MTPFYTILTNYGKTALAEALAAQLPLEIPHMAVGDGSGAYYEPVEEQTNLRNELWRGDLNDLRTDANVQGQVIAEAIIPMGIDGDWTVREIGLFDAKGGLIAVGKYPETYIPSALSGAKSQVHISIIINVNNTAAIQLIVDHGQVLASKLYVDNLDKALRKDISKQFGDVEAWREEFPDDTDCIDAALSASSMVVKFEHGRHYYVRGGVFYSRKFQSVNLNGAFIWLKDDAGVYRLTIFEMDDHSQIFNGTIDGNYQNNIHDSANWVTNVDLIPFAQGVFTSRYLTNNNIPKKAVGARIDNVTVRNTIRSNFVLTGKDQLHGNITAQNSYADHLIYFTGSDNVKYEKAYIDGICRGEAISIGTAGSGVETTNPADKFGGKVLRIQNVKKSPFYINGYNEEPVWIQGRDVGAECSGSFDEVYIDDTEIENELAGNGRRIAFGGLYNVTIGLLKTNTVITPTSIVDNAYIVDARNGAKVNITHYRLKAKTRETGYTFPMGPFRADASSTIRVGYFKNEFIAEDAINYRNFYADNANIFIDTVNSEQLGGTLFRIIATTQDAAITIGSVERMVGWGKIEDINRLGTRLYEGRVRFLAMRHLRSPNKTASETPNVFNISRFELYSEDEGFYYIGAPKNGMVGQTVEIVGDGKAQRGNDINVVWQGGNDFKFRTIGQGEIIELFLNVDGKWYEKPRNNYGSYVVYRTGSPVGSIIPLYPWQECLDTLSKRWYKATGTASVNDWVALN